MAENQFKFDRDTVATNLKTLIVYDDLHKDNLELKDTMKRIAIEMMGG